MAAGFFGARRSGPPRLKNDRSPLQSGLSAEAPLCRSRGAALLLSDAPHRIKGLLQPAPKEPLPCHHVEHAHPHGQWIDSETSINESAAPRPRQGKVHKGAGVDAADPHFAKLVETVNHDIELLDPEWTLGQLSVAAALLQALALHLNHLRPPFRVTFDIANELPDDFDRRVDPLLLTMLGHCPHCPAPPDPVQGGGCDVLNRRSFSLGLIASGYRFSPAASDPPVGRASYGLGRDECVRLVELRLLLDSRLLQDRRQDFAEPLAGLF